MSTPAQDRADTEAYKQALERLRRDEVEEGLAILHGIRARMPKVLGDIAFAHRSRGENDKALTYLQQYVESFPDDPAAWSLMSRIAREQNALDRAADYVRRALDLQPQNPQLHFELAEILFHRGDCRGAVRAYNRCLKLDPDFDRAQARRALARRVVRTERIRTITWRPPFTWILRWLLARNFVGDLIEEVMGITLDERRWQTPMDWGTAAVAPEPVPPGQEPDRFADHFARCGCPFWTWFRGLKIERRARKALDLGVGPGHVAHHFARHGFEVCSVTPSEFARRERERRGIAARKGDLHLTGERGRSFDLVLAAYALHHCRAPLFALWEWKRLLRPDGCLLVMVHLPLDRPAPEYGGGRRETGGEREETEGGKPDGESVSRAAGSETENAQSEIPRVHYACGNPPHVMTLTYWQLRWLFKLTGFQLIAETLEDPARRRLESVEHVDGRRVPEPDKAWNAFFLLRKPGRLPFDGALEKPRPLAPELQLHSPADNT